MHMYVRLIEANFRLCPLPCLNFAADLFGCVMLRHYHSEHYQEGAGGLLIACRVVLCRQCERLCMHRSSLAVSGKGMGCKVYALGFALFSQPFCSCIIAAGIGHTG